MESVITLDPEDIDEAQDISNSNSDKYIKLEMPFNSLITKDLNEAIQTI